MTSPLVPGDALVFARDFMMPEFAARGVDYSGYSWHMLDVPEVRPERFIVIDQLNTRQDDIFHVDVLTQFRVYDADPRRAKNAAFLVNGLAPQLPAGLEVLWTEHAGGPTELPDPDVPGLRRWLVTWWLTVACVPA